MHVLISNYSMIPKWHSPGNTLRLFSNVRLNEDMRGSDILEGFCCFFTQYCRLCVCVCRGCKDHSPWWNMSLTTPDLFFVLSLCNLWPPNITSNFTCGTLRNLGHTSKNPDTPCHTHTHTQSQMSPFIIITNSLGIPDYDQPILLGVTDRFWTWKPMIGHS